MFPFVGTLLHLVGTLAHRLHVPGILLAASMFEFERNIKHTAQSTGNTPALLARRDTRLLEN